MNKRRDGVHGPAAESAVIRDTLPGSSTPVRPVFFLNPFGEDQERSRVTDGVTDTFEGFDPGSE